jgi:hypothetical protein
MTEPYLFQDKHITIEKDRVCLNDATILTQAIQGYRKVAKTSLYTWIVLPLCLAGILVMYSIPNPPDVSSPSSSKNKSFSIMCIVAGILSAFKKRHFVLINTGSQSFQTPDLENGEVADRIIQTLNQVTRRA